MDVPITGCDRNPFSAALGYLFCRSLCIILKKVISWLFPALNFSFNYKLQFIIDKLWYTTTEIQDSFDIHSSFNSGGGTV